MGKNDNNLEFGNINDTLIDDDVVAAGIELDIGKGRVITITQSGSGNRKYRAEMRRVFKNNNTALGVSTMSDDEANELLKEVYAKTVVMGWKGFTDPAGAEIPCSTDNCVKLFNASQRIFEVVQEEAAKFSNFAREDVVESGK